MEGVFRNASEITLQLLRDNKDVLMSVLDAFIHDPLVEWVDEKRKLERRGRNGVKSSVDLRKLAKNALYPIEKKLRGLYAKDANRSDKRIKEISTSNLVQMLIEEATDLRNLVSENKETHLRSCSLPHRLKCIPAGRRGIDRWHTPLRHVDLGLNSAILQFI